MEKVPPINIEEWEPKTKIGQKVKSGEITSLEQIEEMGAKILEHEIASALFPNLESETLLIKTTQRVTDSGRKIKFRVIVLVGDRNGHIGIGVGKSEEVRPAITYAIKDAKKHMVSVLRGCGSWECRCDTSHSIPEETRGKMGSTIVILKPAPKGVGLVCNDTIKKVLTLAGIKDVWSQTQGNTSNIYNTAMATIKALRNLVTDKPHPEENR